MTTWQKLTLHIPADLADTITDFLNDNGALAVTLQAGDAQEIFEVPIDTTPLWQHTTISALFTADTDISILPSSLQSLIGMQQLSYQMDTVVDQDWQKNCTDAFKPICFADKLWIYPSWHSITDDNKARLLLDPGIAFGTGAHPTTALCVEWLANHIQGGETVIDYGCGSGILGLAAAKLGAAEIWCVDIDPQALAASQNNAQQNAITLHTVLPEQLPVMTADVLIANILANPLIQLAPRFNSLLKVGAHIVLSGILAEQVNRIVETYRPWVNFSAPTFKDEWACVAGVVT